MSQFNGNLSLLSLTQDILTILSNGSFLSAFITTILFHIQGNQWRQPGMVYGWLIILQMSQLDKKHIEG